jgi:hypothetical protein
MIEHDRSRRDAPHDETLDDLVLKRSMVDHEVPLNDATLRRFIDDKEMSMEEGQALYRRLRNDEGAMERLRGMIAGIEDDAERENVRACLNWLEDRLQEFYDVGRAKRLVGDSQTDRGGGAEEDCEKGP